MLQSTELKRHVQSTMITAVLAKKLNVDWLNLFVHRRDILPSTLQYKPLHLNLFAEIGVTGTVEASPLALCVLFEKRTMFSLYYTDHVDSDRKRAKRFNSLWQFIRIHPDIITAFIGSCKQTARGYNVIAARCLNLQWLLKSHYKAFANAHEHLMAINVNFAKVLYEYHKQVGRPPLLLALTPPILEKLHPRQSVFSSDNLEMAALYYRRVFSALLSQRKNARLIKKFCSVTRGRNYLLSTLIHHTRPFFARLRRFNRRQINKTVVTTVTSGQVFYVPETIAPYSNGVLSFYYGTSHFTTVIRPSQSGPFFFFKAGSYHTAFETLLPSRFKGRVFNLRFAEQKVISNGVAIPCSFFEDKQCFYHSTKDVTFLFPGVRKIRKKRRNSTVPVNIPFPNYNLINMDDWRIFASYINHVFDMSELVMIAYGILSRNCRVSVFNRLLTHLLQRKIEANTGRSIAHTLRPALKDFSVHSSFSDVLNVYIALAKYPLALQSLNVILELSEVTGPDLVREFLLACARERLTFRTTTAMETADLITMVLSRYTPPRVKRLALHVLDTQGVGMSLHSEARHDEAWYRALHATYADVKIQLEFTPTHPHSINIVFDRTTMDFHLNQSLLRFAHPKSPGQPKYFSLRFHGEEGTGQSVYEEVLKVAWKNAIDANLMAVSEADGCVTFGLGDATNLGDPPLYAFTLGMITGLIMRRGVFLPFQLSTRMWKYLRGDIDSLKVHFDDGAQYYERHCTAMTVDEFNECFDTECTTQPECEEYIMTTYSPKPELAQMFHSGIGCFWPEGSLGIFHACELNSMFSAVTAGTEITAANLERSIELISTRDRAFFEKVKQLSTDDLRRFVKFVTGKERLPLAELTESKIQFRYDRDATTPRAQNCVNMLILPADSASWDRCLYLMLNFESDFGFA